MNFKFKNFLEDNKGILTLLIIYFILIYKTLISTYLNSLITLIPSIIILILFIMKLFQKKLKFRLYDVFFALMISIGAISGIFHKQPIIAILYQIKSLSIYYLLFIIIRNSKYKKESILKLSKVININTVILIILSFIEIIFHKNILFPKSWISEIVYADNYIRAYSLICNPNVYAFYLLFIFVLNYRLNYKNLTLKYFIYNILLISGIILSISRSAYICLSLLLIILIIYLIKIKKVKFKQNNYNNIISIILMCFFSCLLVTSIYSSNSIYKTAYLNNIKEDSKLNVINNTEEQIIKEKLEIKTDVKDRITETNNNEFVQNSLNNGRLAILKFGINTLKGNFMFGSGFSSFLTASSFLNSNEEAKKLGLSYADNQYIAILVETGITGFSCLVIFAIILLINFIKSQNLILIIISFIFAFFGLFINVLEVQIISFIYFLSLGFLMRSDKNDKI